MEVLGKSYYVNPNTRTLTTNLKNTKVYDWRAASTVASNIRNDVGFTTKERTRWTENVTKVLSYLGIDTSKDFTVNGMQYTKDEDGNFVSQTKREAMEAYEKLKAANQTYRFADERTKTAISYMSHYYLKTVPENVVNAWNETLEETGINPFPEGYSGVLQQLAMEQDFATGGNDNLFGDTEESSRKAVEAILERIDNPIGTIRSEDRAFYDDQKTFYTALLAKMKGED